MEIDLDSRNYDEIDRHREMCRDRPGHRELCTLALGRSIRRIVAEGIPIGVVARDENSIKIDFEFDLKVKLNTLKNHMGATEAAT